MSIIETWKTGSKNYKECLIEEIDNQRYFTTILHNCEYELGRKLEDIFFDHVSDRQTKYVEILYSGGMDSELVLNCLLSKGVPCKVITMIIKYKGIILNTHDLYYSEKFCRSRNLKQTLIELDVVNFFESGKYLDYLKSTFITEPHVATHFWLIEQCSYFPILGGDWPWVHLKEENKVISPARLDYSYYENFMKTKGISGIGNMLNNSLESTIYFIKMHIEKGVLENNIPLIKHKIFSQNIDLEPRIRSYGWERIPHNIFNIFEYKAHLIKLKNITKSKIYWESQIKDVLNTDRYSNESFL